MEEIQELLSRLESLTAEEMDRLSDLIRTQYQTVAEADPTTENVATLRSLVDAAKNVKAQKESREEAAAAAQAEADALRAEMEALDAPPEERTTLDAHGEGEGEGAEGEGEGEGAGDGEGEGAGAEETDEERAAREAAEAEAAAGGEEGEDADGAEGADTLPIAASGHPESRRGGRVQRMAARSGRARQRPEEPVDEPGRVVVTAGAGLRDLNPGDAIENRSVLASAMCDMLQGLDRDSQPTGRHTVARARWDDAYPAERRLGRDAEINSAKMEAICAPTAVLASGGVCLPVNVDYSVPTWADANRPLRDALPAFQADRGGVRYVSPPDIGVVDLQASASGAGQATRVWTEATDASPSGQTKPVWTVQCGAEQLVYVNAIPTRIQFGNMFGRFAPEQVAANTDVALSSAAREAELELLTLMFAASKQVVPAQYLGATRDILSTVSLLISQYRYSHRIPATATFVAVFPEWAKEVIRADMARELAHDNDGRDVMAITDAQIEAWFAIRGVKQIIWTEDALKAGTYGTGGASIPNQFFPLATAGAAPQWPGQTSNAAFKLAWLLYVEGSYQFLDGGRLDLGVVRDSTLDATNDYETFVEPFEGLAFRGLEVYQVQSTLLPTGGSAGTVAATSYVE